jgi:hypothetical protein
MGVNTGALYWGIDSAAQITPAIMEREQADFAMRYLAPYPAEQWKLCTIDEVRTLQEANYPLVFMWEDDGLPHGYNHGRDCGKQIETLLKDRKCEGAAVIAAYADTNPVTFADVENTVLGLRSVLGWERTGSYQDYACTEYLAARNVCKYYQQTYAWSQGHRSRHATIYQWKNTQSIDYDTAWAEDYGQWPPPDNPATHKKKGHKPTMSEPDYSTGTSSNEAWAVLGADAIKVPWKSDNEYWRVENALADMWERIVEVQQKLGA